MMKEWHLRYFNSGQLDMYLQKPVVRLKGIDGKVGWEDWRRYHHDHHAFIKSLMTTPFSVRMIVDILPTILSGGSRGERNALKGDSTAAI